MTLCLSQVNSSYGPDTELTQSPVFSWGNNIGHSNLTLRSIVTTGGLNRGGKKSFPKSKLHEIRVLEDLQFLEVRSNHRGHLWLKLNITSGPVS